MRPVMATSSVLSDTLRSMPTGWLSRSLTRRYSVTASRTRSRHAADCSGSRKPTSIHDVRTSSATPAGVRWPAGRSQKSRSTLWVAMPTEVWARCGRACGRGRSRYCMR